MASIVLTTLSMVRTRARSLSFLGALVSLMGCATAPPRGAAPLGGSRGVQIQLEAPASPHAGPYRVYASPDGASWTLTGTVPAHPSAPSVIHVAAERWKVEGCERSVYLRLRTRRGALVPQPFDARALEGHAAAEISHTCPLRGCRSRSEARLRLVARVAGPDHLGDLELSTADAVSAFNRTCARRVVGDLHVHESLRESVTLSHLEEVDGHLHVDAPTFVDDTHTRRNYPREFPRLRAIRGHLTVVMSESGGGNASLLDVGFDRLERVEGDVELRTVATAGVARLSGFEWLSFIGGELRLSPPGLELPAQLVRAEDRGLAIRDAGR